MQDALDQVFYRRDEVGIAPDFFARRPADEPQGDEENEMRTGDGKPDGEADCPRPGIVGVVTRDDDANREEGDDEDGVHGGLRL